MTPEEAIRELKSDRALYETDIVFANDGTPDGDLIQAINMAIEALEKQVEKKPKPTEEQNIRYVMKYTCPSCGKHFIGTGASDYCYCCGQALDWRETE